ISSQAARKIAVVPWRCQNSMSKDRSRSSILPIRSITRGTAAASDCGLSSASEGKLSIPCFDIATYYNRPDVCRFAFLVLLSQSRGDLGLSVDWSKNEKRETRNAKRSL